MDFRTFHYRWKWDLDASPEALWPLVSDTNRFDRDTGLPALEDRSDGRLANARIRAYFTRFGVPLEYVQEPFEWIRPHRFGVVRRFNSGPVAVLRVLAELDSTAEGGTRLTYQTWATPANPLGFLAIPGQIGVLSRISFERVFRAYDQLAADGRTFLDTSVSTVEFAPGARQRLASIHRELRTQVADPSLADRLVRFVETADPLSLQRMRPYALADAWQVSRRALLELSLLATRLGLLAFRWDLLCPLCRGAKESYTTLGLMQSGVHCETCNINFNANFEQSVELTFRPNPNIRLVEDDVFCISAPSATPHVAVQQLIAPGESRQLEPVLEVGRYRIRTLEQPGGQFIRVDSDGQSVLSVAAAAEWPGVEPQIGTQPTFILHNETSEEQLFILERLAWTDQAATAAEVTTLQRFRDLFSQEALRPGERIAVSSLTILFTDLRGSTSIYRQIGDAPAFGLVMAHFDVLREAIAAEGGGIVKNIGDSIMAAFRQPAAALRAILRARAELASLTSEGQTLVLKAGIHHGPCIAVTLNERLDYFGSTVNIAARLESLSTGNEIVISESVRNDPEVNTLLSDPTTGLLVGTTEAEIKGYEDRRFKLWLVAERDPELAAQ